MHVSILIPFHIGYLNKIIVYPHTDCTNPAHIHSKLIAATSAILMSRGSGVKIYRLIAKSRAKALQSNHKGYNSTNYSYLP